MIIWIIWLIKGGTGAPAKSSEKSKHRIVAVCAQDQQEEKVIVMLKIIKIVNKCHHSLLVVNYSRHHILIFRQNSPFKRDKSDGIPYEEMALYYPQVHSLTTLYSYHRSSFDPPLPPKKTSFLLSKATILSFSHEWPYPLPAFASWAII